MLDDNTAAAPPLLYLVALRLRFTARVPPFFAAFRAHLTVNSTGCSRNLVAALL